MSDFTIPLLRELLLKCFERAALDSGQKNYKVLCAVSQLKLVVASFESHFLGPLRLETLDDVHREEKGTGGNESWLIGNHSTL